MWYLDINDDVHNVMSKQNDGDVKGICDLVGYVLRSF